MKEAGFENVSSDLLAPLLFSCVPPSSSSVVALAPAVEQTELRAPEQDALDTPRQQVQGEGC